MIQPRNLLIAVNDISGIHSLLAQGYKILLCTEDQLPPDILLHPNIIKATILLPEYQSVSLELDGNIESAMNSYWSYLAAYEPAWSMCNIVYIAALIGQPIALYFGSEFQDFKLLQNLPTYLQNYVGLTFGYALGYGAIDLDKAPYILNGMYMNQDLNAMQVLSYYPPGMDILPETVDKLMAELNPPIQIGDIQGGNEYFKQIVLSMKGRTTNSYGQKLYMPIIGGHAQ